MEFLLTGKLPGMEKSVKATPAGLDYLYLTLGVLSGMQFLNTGNAGFCQTTILDTIALQAAVFEFWVGSDWNNAIYNTIDLTHKLYPLTNGCKNGAIEIGNQAVAYTTVYQSGLQVLDTLALNVGVIYDGIIKGILDWNIGGWEAAGVHWGDAIYGSFFTA